MRGIEYACRANLKTIRDPELRRKLTPDYQVACKRILLSNTLYPALGLPHVTLHDKHDAIQEITPTGARTASGHVDLDVIVWATGYDATDAVISYPVVGRGGQTLADFWRAYPRAYLGTAVPGFPNLFILTGPNTGIGHTSALFIIESQLEYVDACLARLEATGAASVEVRADAEAAWTEEIHREMARTVWKSGGCKSWYQSKSGHVVAMFPGFSFTFRRLARRFRPEHHELRAPT
jgi:cation diffusion facilitator CzcD-associated flavoprotein CzcO